MTKIVGFDLDDTLIPEVQFLMSGSHHIAKWLHDKYHDLPKDRIIAVMLTAIMNCRNHYSALERLLEEYNMTGSIDMKEVVAEFRNHQPDPAIYHPAPSVIELLAKLKRNNEVRTVLITDGRSFTQRNKIKAAGLYAYFAYSDIYISEETGHDKTDSDTFLRIMEKYAGATEFHYVGDNPSKDFLHPSRLGWITHQTNPFPLMIHHPQGMPR
ncbi:MAG: HAD family hydrolase [Muribaculaceae bacterium]|nr:HAD family hydrolase [Muribaculaceae bacterium]